MPLLDPKWPPERVSAPESAVRRTRLDGILLDAFLAWHRASAVLFAAAEARERHETAPDGPPPDADDDLAHDADDGPIVPAALLDALEDGRDAVGRALVARAAGHPAGDALEDALAALAPSVRAVLDASGPTLPAETPAPGSGPELLRAGAHLANHSLAHEGIDAALRHLDGTWWLDTAQLTDEAAVLVLTRVVLTHLRAFTELVPEARIERMAVDWYLLRWFPDPEAVSEETDRRLADWGMVERVWEIVDGSLLARVFDGELLESLPDRILEAADLLEESRIALVRVLEATEDGVRVRSVAGGPSREVARLPGEEQHEAGTILLGRLFTVGRRTFFGPGVEALDVTAAQAEEIDREASYLADAGLDGAGLRYEVALAVVRDGARRRVPEPASSRAEAREVLPVVRRILGASRFAAALDGHTVLGEWLRALRRQADGADPRARGAANRKKTAKRKETERGKRRH